MQNSFILNKKIVSFDQVCFAPDQDFVFQKPKCLEHVIKMLVKRYENVVAMAENTQIANKTDPFLHFKRFADLPKVTKLLNRPDVLIINEFKKNLTLTLQCSPQLFR